MMIKNGQEYYEKERAKLIKYLQKLEVQSSKGKTNIWDQPGVKKSATLVSRPKQ